MESIQFMISDPLDRTGYNQTTMDMVYWTLIQTVSHLLLTISMHLYLVDIVAYFDADPERADGLYRPTLLSGVVDLTLAARDDLINQANKFIAIAQNWTFNIYITYLTPNQLVYYMEFYVMTPTFQFIRDQIFQVEQVIVPTAEG